MFNSAVSSRKVEVQKLNLESKISFLLQVPKPEILISKAPTEL